MILSMIFPWKQCIITINRGFFPLIFPWTCVFFTYFPNDFDLPHDSMAMTQEPIDWRYRFHIFLAYFLGLNFRGYTPKIWPEIWFPLNDCIMDFPMCLPFYRQDSPPKTPLRLCSTRPQAAPGDAALCPAGLHLWRRLPGEFWVEVSWDVIDSGKIKKNNICSILVY